MRQIPSLAFGVTVTLTAAAEAVLSEVSGNWADSEETGFSFLA